MQKSFLSRPHEGAVLPQPLYPVGCRGAFEENVLLLEPGAGATCEAEVGVY
jgi:hypothetical protein